MECVKTREPVLQWHPAFFADIRIEFCREESKMDFENEHQLGTKPMQIDVLIIKKNSDLASVQGAKFLVKEPDGRSA